MSTKYKPLMREREAPDSKIAVYYGAEKLDAIDAVRQLVKEHGHEIGDLPVAVGRAAEAKYRNPKTGETWSGRGRPPRWIEGRDRKPFRI
jgi:DNA-binding protein H-NS